MYPKRLTKNPNRRFQWLGKGTFWPQTLALFWVVFLIFFLCVLWTSFSSVTLCLWPGIVIHTFIKLARLSRHACSGTVAENEKMYRHTKKKNKQKHLWKQFNWEISGRQAGSAGGPHLPSDSVEPVHNYERGGQSEQKSFYWDHGDCKNLPAGHTCSQGGAPV